ncbi:external alternative NAD(P)H-ubiquinone oxidoreductase B1, mitochondrial-like [Andrographis paniculata]|uniref:external alternative NAD(P)H-ubiquinone oxidoreductase B1, mitochondrial-like n=1 Tax=Andrographis paniculata TaxID=175694 RepID=UPI0021E7AD14|nr:external alternative NAD(P)H-ubiquinone oxidoreductase B1, mitochondrial-like [Andrographis paniculata]
MKTRFFSCLKTLINTGGQSAASNSTKLLLICAISGTGGVAAYADSNSSAAPKKKQRVLVLGTGWAATSFLKDLDISTYDVQVVSPRNYFAFTPLLPSVTCGTVEARSVVEPVRNIVKKRNGEIKFWEAECLKIDHVNRKVFCRSNIDEDLPGDNSFSLNFDYLVIAVGAEVNTFNTQGVKEHCHFLKEVEDAQSIRRAVIDRFEKAVLPELTEEERKMILHFVIVGGGPTGIEFAAELHDFVHEDLVKIYPSVKDLVSITVIQSGDHILNTFDERISTFAEKKFKRDGIEVLTGHRVMGVTDRKLHMKAKATGEEISIPHGMIVWSTGVGTRPVIKEFMEQIGQGNRRVLAIDEWCRVRGLENIYAIGDCSTLCQKKIMEDITDIFREADTDNSGTLSMEEFEDVIEDVIIQYPQIELYLKSKMLNVSDLLKSMYNGKEEVDIDKFKLALSVVDEQTKSLPATAQVAAQQGAYLSNCFNRMEQCKKNPEGPRKFQSGGGRHEFRPFRYRHLGQFAPLGGEQAAAELPGDWVSMGRSTQWLWYSIYASKQVSWRTRLLVISDWCKRYIFGRDSSRI